jgi:hypothetical protein
MATPRRIILSRKGFDAAYGGVASPIFPDGTMLSLPIPHPGSPHPYDAIRFGSAPLGALVEQLTRGRVKDSHRAHLDPDLRADSIARANGWRPVFGQCGAAQSHLARYGVGPGDLFLFFGWFRAVQAVGGRWRFVPHAPDLHVIYGWLQIDEVLGVEAALTHTHPWLAEHPHLHGRYGPNNTLYTATSRLDLGSHTLSASGGGALARFRPELCLTQPEATRRSTWRLPPWCFPRADATPLTYHEASRWTRNGEHVALASVPRGQEFVLDTTLYPEAIGWVQALLEQAGSTGRVELPTLASARVQP